jgi:hypothetical protein
MRLDKQHFQRQLGGWITFKWGVTIDRYLELKKPFKFNGYIRRGSFVDELFCDHRRIIFPHSGFKTGNGWIYRTVINDVTKYLRDGGSVTLSRQYPAVLWNNAMKEYEGKITGTDIDHAYWRIAYNKGYITLRTYTKGLDLENKAFRNSALANLTSNKEWFILRDGMVTKKSFMVSKTDDLTIVYNDIRYSCYRMMRELSELLGNDFICYKVDCIYYVDTKKNRKLAQDYIRALDMDWKQLEEQNIKNHKKQKHEKSNAIN